jgi:hypothetical protein
VNTAIGAGWLGSLVVVCCLFVGCQQTAPAAADDPLGSVRLTPTVSDTSLVATGAFADFGVNGGGARQVRVRIIDSMDLGLHIASDHEIVLAEPPVLCLVGPYSAPDDAGLESPCWGEPDLSPLLAAKLARDSAGHYVLGTTPIDLNTTLQRGAQRCDYPPGKWQVELKLNPVGSSEGARYIPDTTFEVPITNTGPLQLLPTTQTRYCGLATAVVQQQGEPEVVAP